MTGQQLADAIGRSLAWTTKVAGRKTPENMHPSTLASLAKVFGFGETPESLLAAWERRSTPRPRATLEVAGVKLTDTQKNILGLLAKISGTDEGEVVRRLVQWVTSHDPPYAMYMALMAMTGRGIGPLFDEWSARHEGAMDIRQLPELWAENLEVTSPTKSAASLAHILSAAIASPDAKKAATEKAKPRTE